MKTQTKNCTFTSYKLLLIRIFAIKYMLHIHARSIYKYITIIHIIFLFDIKEYEHFTFSQFNYTSYYIYF